MTETAIIKSPIITERSMINAGIGWYTFKVDKKSTKKDIRREIERLFKVNVKEIRTQIVKGKKTRAGRSRNIVKKSNWKKAFVRLAKEQKIALFEVSHEKEKV